MTGPSVLVVAGLDPSGGAGLLADVDAVRAAGGRPCAVCAALTAQGDRGVGGIQPIFGDFVQAQIKALGPMDAAKTGMLGSASAVEALLSLLDLGEIPAPVVDPVVHSSSGHPLIDGAGAELIRRDLLVRSAAVTPNLSEAAWLSGRAVERVDQMEDAARALVDAGCPVVVITGGHLRGELLDVVMLQGASAPRLLVRHRVSGTARGTGCRFASFLAARLALGDDPVDAVEQAGDHVAHHIRLSHGSDRGRRG